MSPLFHYSDDVSIIDVIVFGVDNSYKKFCNLLTEDAEYSALLTKLDSFTTSPHGEILTALLESQSQAIKQYDLISASEAYILVLVFRQLFAAGKPLMPDDNERRRCTARIPLM